jgi:hypothetical protein
MRRPTDPQRARPPLPPAQIPPHFQRPGAPALGQRPPDGGRWRDQAHGHNREYPRPGWVVHQPPPLAYRTVWSGVPYHFYQGVWYSGGPRGHGHVVVLPPRGLVVAHLPSWRTVVVIGGLSYLYLNSTYYRERPQGDYEVVMPDASGDASGGERLYVYPREGQSVEQQAVDEYDCFRWASRQTGLEPLGGASSAGPDFRRAYTACLEARGYTVR